MRNTSEGEGVSEPCGVWRSGRELGLKNSSKEKAGDPKVLHLIVPWAPLQSHLLSVLFPSHHLSGMEIKLPCLAALMDEGSLWP